MASQNLRVFAHRFCSLRAEFSPSAKQVINLWRIMLAWSHVKNLNLSFSDIISNNMGML